MIFLLFYGFLFLCMIFCDNLYLLMVCFGFDRGLCVLELREVRVFICFFYNICYVKIILIDYGNDRVV